MPIHSELPLATGVVSTPGRRRAKRAPLPRPVYGLRTRLDFPLPKSTTVLTYEDKSTLSGCPPPGFVVEARNGYRATLFATPRVREESPMRSHAEAMVLASLTADAHALGAHWIYDTRRIATEIGRVDTLLKPLPDSFHSNREAGCFTHYGDQTAVLLESIAERGGFHLEDFWHRWRALFASYDGYVDQATKATLINIEAGKGPEDCGSFTDELAGAARIAPLVRVYADDPETLEEAVGLQTRMTHNNPIVVQGGVFFARVARGVLSGEAPTAVMEKEAGFFSNSPVFQWVREGIRSREVDSVDAIRRFGQTCHAEEAFPSTVHIIARYENNLKEALVQSVMAGGDSAGRGLLIGMILGAHLGEEAIPRDWVDGLISGDAVRRNLARIP